MRAESQVLRDPCKQRTVTEEPLKPSSLQHPPPPRRVGGFSRSPKEKQRDASRVVEDTQSAPSTRSTSADTREVRSHNRDPSIYSPGRGGGIKCPLLYSSPETQKKSAGHPAQPRPPQQPNSPHRRTAPQESPGPVKQAKGGQQFGQDAQKNEAQQSGERGPPTSSPSTDPPHSRITHPEKSRGA
ncbi:hypothetical protein TcG_11861 [Trypanosoma cruzi]|nr:hypothetical protein TcG_11861 [Trypanosoma cruzi]